MSYFTFRDISYAQGQYDMSTDLSPVVEMKMTGFYYGSKQPYVDVQAVRNYSNAVRMNKVPVLYHFAGGADPVVEADYFVNVGCSPLADGDIYELDYELTDDMNPPADPDAWCRTFADRLKTRTGAYPLLYTNTSTFLRYGGFPKTMEVCGLIIADYRYTPDQDIPCNHPYIIHQYTDTPIDTNACFIDIDTLKKYARQSQATQPISPPVQPPIVTTTTTVDPPVTTTTTVTTEPTVPVEPVTPVLPVDPIAPVEPIVPQPVVVITKQTTLDKIKSAILAFIAWLVS